MLLILINLIFTNANAADLAKPLNLLFSHKAHQNAFNKTEISCTKCHNFSVKPKGSDPLAEGVPSGLLKVSRKVCHECHMGKISLPRPNQCTLCHKNVEKLMPESHKKNWAKRHGHIAQLNSDACKDCHTDKTCTQCHTQRDTLKPNVHRPNFRLTHSIEARANPQSCVVCHANTSSCTQCHTRGLR
ncbi:MAG: hypothetical protein IPM57_11235 [Oligoflexia bacterium]|nr:hypothetical protein [Oligoflexia bacterium]